MRQLACIACLVCLTACAHTDSSLSDGVSNADQDGLAALEKAFRNSSDADLRAREQKLVAAARDGRYFASISGLQGLRRDPNLTVQQLTAIQDAVGKMQSRLAERVAQGKEAQRHVNSLQSETERLRE